MGGNPPLGYDVRERKLVINAAEAATVRSIFDRFPCRRFGDRAGAGLGRRGRDHQARQAHRQGKPLQAADNRPISAWRSTRVSLSRRTRGHCRSRIVGARTHDHHRQPPGFGPTVPAPRRRLAEGADLRGRRRRDVATHTRKTRSAVSVLCQSVGAEARPDACPIGRFRRPRSRPR